MKRCIIVGIVLMQAPAVAEAAEPERAATAADENAAARAEDQARERFNEGRRLFFEGLLPDAVRAFDEAFALHPAPNVLLAKATALRHMGRNAEAGLVLRAYLAHPQAVASRREEVEHLLREVDARTGVLRIRTREPEVTVTVDGRTIAGGSARDVRLDPGVHTVIAKLQGRQAAQAMSIEAGRTSTWDLEFEPERVAFYPVLRGPHAEDVVGVTFVSIAGAAAAVGIGVGIDAWMVRNDAFSYCLPDQSVCDQRAQPLADEATLKANIATGTLVVALVTAGVGITLLAIPKGSDEGDSSGPAVLGALGPGGFRW